MVLNWVRMMSMCIGIVHFEVLCALINNHRCLLDKRNEYV